MQIHNQSERQIRESNITTKIKYQTIILVRKDLRSQTNVECVETPTHRIGQQTGDCDRTILSAISVVLTLLNQCSKEHIPVSEVCKRKMQEHYVLNVKGKRQTMEPRIRYY